LFKQKFIFIQVFTAFLLRRRLRRDIMSIIRFIRCYICIERNTKTRISVVEHLKQQQQQQQKHHIFSQKVPFFIIEAVYLRDGSLPGKLLAKVRFTLSEQVYERDASQ
jgi:hypothetical protein